MSTEYPVEPRKASTQAERYVRPEKPPFSSELIAQGVAAEALYQAEFGFLPEDHEVTREIQALLDAYPGTNKPTRIRISLDTSQPNAFILPNGTMVLNRALLSIVDLQELRVVMAHETTHYRERHTEEFKKMKEGVGLGRAGRSAAIRFFGAQRLGEWQADVQGIVEGDEAGTHPAALRTLMRKLESWDRDMSAAAPDLVHGREIDRIVNAGLATQVYDFEADYTTRTPLSETIKAFCTSEVLPRFPEAGDCDGGEAREAFKDKNALDILICLRTWRSEDLSFVEEHQCRRKEAIKKEESIDPNDQLESMPLVGEGYGVAFEELETRIDQTLPELTAFQRRALRHILIEAVTSITASDLEDSAFAPILDYQDEMNSATEVEAVRALITPAIFQRLGVVLPDGQGLPRVLGSILGAANAAEAYADGEGDFSLDAYLEASKGFFRGIHDLLAQDSLVGSEGFVLADTILEELLLNIDVRQQVRPAVEAALRFQQVLVAEGLPSQASRIHRILKKQRFYERLQSEELAGEEAATYSTGFLTERLVTELYRHVHPALHQMDVERLAYFGGSRLFEYMGAADFRVLFERRLLDESVSYHTAQKDYFSDNTDWMAQSMQPFDRPPSVLGRQDRMRILFLRQLFEKLEFKKHLETSEGVCAFLRAMNALQEELFDETHSVHFEKVVFFAFTYLLREAKDLPWLPPVERDRRMTIFRLFSTVPGAAVSRLLTSSDYHIGFTHDVGQASSMAVEATTILLREGSSSGARMPGMLTSPHDAYIEIETAAVCARMMREAFAGDVLNDQLTKKDAVAMIRSDQVLGCFQREFISSRTDLFLDAESPVEEAVDKISQAFLKDLDDPDDQLILLWLSNQTSDPLLRSEVIRCVVERRLKDPHLTVEQGIDLLFQNRQIRGAFLGDARTRFIDERVQTPGQLEYLRRIVMHEAEDASLEGVGVYAIVERLEREKDSLEIFKLFYEYHFSDEVLKKDLFCLLRQDWRDGGKTYTDEDALLKTDAVLQGLEQSDEVVKHALVRKLLIGEKGLLHRVDQRKALFGYLLESAVDTQSASPELQDTVKEVLEVVAETVEIDVLFFALAPFLQDRLFAAPMTRASWEDILTDVYNGSKGMAKDTWKAVEGIRHVLGNQTALEQIDEDSVSYHLSEYRYRQTLIGLGVPLEGSVGVSIGQPLPTLEGMIVRVAESLGADGVRFLQLLGQYIPNLSPELEEALRDANDNVRGQPKLTAYETQRKRAPALSLLSFGRRLGGGSLMSPYDSKITLPDGTERRVALKVLAPNAEFVSDTVEKELHRVVDVLVARKSEKYFPAKLALEDISQWIRQDINDRDFFTYDSDFRRVHGGFTVPGFRYALVIPESFPVPGGDTANKHVKAEAFVEGTTLNRLFADPQGHDLKQIVALVTKSFAQQLVRGIMHSDIHPGNYMIGKQGDQECVPMIDRSNYLVLNERDQNLVLGVTQEGLTGVQRITFLKEYLSEDVAARRQAEDFWLEVASIIEENGERGIRMVMARLRQVGVQVPLRLTLLLKNMNSLNRMAQRVGFHSFREALGYLP